MPHSDRQSLQEGIDLHRAKRYPEAEAIYRKLLVENSKHREAALMLGILAAQTDREEIAIPLLEEVASADATNFDAVKWLSAVLSYLQRYDQAELYAVRAVNLRPDNYGALLELATVYFGSGKYDLALDVFKRAITLDSRPLDAYFGLATTFLRLGDPLSARWVLRDAVRIRPDRETLLKLGEVCLACERPKEAIESASKVLASEPNNVEALTLLVRAYRNGQMETEEDQALQELLKLGLDDPLTHTLHGRRLQSLGKFEEAEKEFARSIELKPNQGTAYYGITAGRKLSGSDQELILRMEGEAARKEMNQDEQAHLHFALGKAYDNVGDYGKAMAHFDDGNKLMRELRVGTRRYDRTATSAQIDQVIKLFTKEFIEANQPREALAQGPRPIFVAGIMRSGTTLAEQILSCHPDIGGGGEQGFWRQVESECIDYEAGRINAETVRAKAQEFKNLLAKVAPGYPVVTDKNPANRMVYGLLQIAFPDCRIIHMRRNPVDVAISIYTTLIRTGAPFVGDRDEIVFALKEHERLTNHWKSVLPSDRFLEVVYEELVQDRERTTRRMVEFCGVPWNDLCLAPERNLRTVVTPSFWQVRQPVYTGSLDRWKRYLPFLGPFAELLDS